MHGQGMLWWRPGELGRAYSQTSPIIEVLELPLSKKQTRRCLGRKFNNVMCSSYTVQYTMYELVSAHSRVKCTN